MNDATSPPGLSPERARQLVKAMLEHADALRSETHRGGLTDGSDDAYPNGYEQAAKDLARAAGVEAEPAQPNPRAHMAEVSGPAGDPIWVDQRALDFNARAALAGIEPRKGVR